MTAPVTYPPADLAAFGRDELDEDGRTLVRAMATPDDDWRPFVRTMAADAGLAVERTHQILRHLGHHGFAAHGTVRDVDTGRPCGSTWWLTERGAALQKVLGQ